MARKKKNGWRIAGITIAIILGAAALFCASAGITALVQGKAFADVVTTWLPFIKQLNVKVHKASGQISTKNYTTGCKIATLPLAFT